MDLRDYERIAVDVCEENGWGPPRYVDHGASAAVYEVRLSAHAVAALKVYDPAFFDGENALIETKRVQLQQELVQHGCPHLIEVLRPGEIKRHRTWYLLMEFCPWRSLEKEIARVPPEAIHPLIKQLVSAVMFLDEKGLVHRDIKPANIAVSPDFKQLKLLDFGVLRRVAFDEGSGTDGHKFIATAQYSPPEYLLRDEAAGKSGFDAINIYQIGAVLHDLITGTAIFAEEKATKNKFKLFKAVTEKRPRIVSNKVPARLIALCMAALEKDPTARVGGVKLSDFLADDDDLDAVRRRLSNRPAADVPSRPPSLAQWKSQVRSWGRTAAGLELEALGAVYMTAEQMTGGCRWKLAFEGASVPIFLTLVVEDDHLTVGVSEALGEKGSSVVRIGVSGPDIPEAGIPDALAAEYLFALDRALTDASSEASR